MRSWPGILALVAACGGGDEGGDDGGATLRFELGTAKGGLMPYDPPIYFDVADEAQADEARAAIGQALHVNGCIVDEPAPYNDPHWGFHFVEILTFAEVGIEVCDANIAETNADWPGYISGANPCPGGGEGWQVCSWNSRVLAEVE